MTMRATTFAGAAALALAVAAGVTACATPHSPAPGGAQPESTPSGVLVTTQHPVTVLDDGDGAELCLGGVLTSLPPQCGGPVLIGWDWAAHEGAYEDVSGVRWGSFIVTGHFDGTTNAFTPATVISGDGYEWPRNEIADFSSPCPEPAGGWEVLDEVATTLDTMDSALRIAEALPGYAGSWVDQSPNTSTDEMAMNDPLLTILNVRVTGDAAAAAAALRTVWGGMLCVSTGERTHAELSAIQAALPTEGTLASWVDTLSQNVELEVIYDDGTLQAELDEEFGEGIVLVTSALTPAG